MEDVYEDVPSVRVNALRARLLAIPTGKALRVQGSGAAYIRNYCYRIKHRKYHTSVVNDGVLVWWEEKNNG